MKMRMWMLLTVAVVAVGCGAPILNGAKEGLSSDNCKGDLMVCDAFHRSNPTQVTVMTPATNAAVEYRVDSDNAGGFLPDRDIITCTAVDACTMNTGAITVTVQNGLRRIEWEESLPIATSTTLSVYPKIGTQIGAPIVFRRQ